MSQTPPGWQIPHQWAQSYEQIHDLLEKARRQIDPRAQDELRSAAAKEACNLLGELMESQPFQEAKGIIQTTHVDVTIAELRAGVGENAIDELYELLHDAGVSPRVAAKLIDDGVTRALTAEPATLVGEQAVSAFDALRVRTCDLAAEFGDRLALWDRQASEDAKQRLVDVAAVGVGGVLIATLVVAAAAPVAVATIGVAIGGAAVQGAVTLFRVVEGRRTREQRRRGLDG